MRKDPTEFRERFKKWKSGEKVYEVGLPKYEGGKDGSIFSKLKSIPVNLIRQTLYKNVSPLGGYSIKRNIQDFGDYDPYDVSIDDIEADPYVSNEIWAEYLNIPYDKRHETGKQKKIVDSIYKPTNSKENIKYRAIKLDMPHKDRLIEDTDDLPIGKSKNSDIFEDYNLGVHTVGRGVDKDKGEYRSYYDRWDLNPFNGKYEGVRIPKLEKVKDVTMGIGTPLEIYDRLYLNDYYNVKPKDVAPKKGDYYGGWLPEITIYPSRKKYWWDDYRQ